MKIGLITIYHVFNYGSVLQAYATQCVLEDLGAECNMINYRYPNEWQFNKGVIRPNPLKRFVRSIFPSKKQAIYDKFKNKYFNFTKYYASVNALVKADWSSYDAFIAGSDQLWNPRFTLGDPAFLLSFVPKSKKRFSLASSFAANRLEKKYVNQFRNELGKYEKISVREKNGCKIINDQMGLNKDVFVCLDPTLLLSKEKWLQRIHRSNFTKKRNYILYYMWSYAFEPRPYIYEVVKHFHEVMKDGDIIALEGYDMTDSYARKGWIDAGYSSIEEFIDLFANADLIITSSFHGTAFALNFEKPLVSIVPDNAGDDRQSDLLNRVGASNCIVQIGTPLNKINPYYSVTEVKRTLSEIRECNINWIKTNIING